MASRMNCGRTICAAEAGRTTPIAWKTTAATPQIRVQSVRLIGLPSPTAGMWSSRLRRA